MNFKGMLFLLLFVSCSNTDKNKETTQKLKNQYDDREKEVLTYLQNKNCLYFNDSAKWYLYNIYCDDTVPSNITKSSSATYLSYLNLKPVSVGYSYDSLNLDIYYFFLYQDTIPVDHIMTKYHYLVDGVSFNLKTKQISGFLRGHGGRFMVPGDSSRFVNLMQPDIPPFVEKNKDKLNDWYRDALIKHGIKL